MVSEIRKERLPKAPDPPGCQHTEDSIYANVETEETPCHEIEALLIAGH
ncbi:MAG: hypothetical protein SCALA701_15310 [Candidatus Scalindua sp.]|nr:MAG: hypothetical protein SCALA701_15310 [Candidatus Scalindua sp.]